MYYSDPVLSRHSASSTPRPRPAPERPTSEVLDSFDPLLHPRDVTQSPDERLLGSSAVTLVGADGVVTSPDQGNIPLAEARRGICAFYTYKYW